MHIFELLTGFNFLALRLQKFQHFESIWK